jgi:hypothetical protein
MKCLKLLYISNFLGTSRAALIRRMTSHAAKNISNPQMSKPAVTAVLSHPRSQIQNKCVRLAPAGTTTRGRTQRSSPSNARLDRFGSDRSVRPCTGDAGSCRAPAARACASPHRLSPSRRFRQVSSFRAGFTPLLARDLYLPPTPASSRFIFFVSHRPPRPRSSPLL